MLSHKERSSVTMKKFLIVVAVLMLANFAYVYWILPGKFERTTNVNLPHEPYIISDRAAALHKSLFVADLHTDSLLWRRDLRQRSAIGHMDLPRMQQGNVALQVFSATTKSPKGQNYERNDANSDQITLLAVTSFWPPRTWRSIYQRAVYQLEKLHKLAAHSELAVITSKASMVDLINRRSSNERIIGGIYLIEGAHPLEGDIDNLDRLFDQGLRIVGLTHFFDNELGGSLHGIDGEGLTDFGRAVVRRTNELGMTIDVAHASPKMVAEVLELSRSPVVLSHGGVKGVCDTARNLDDALMLEVARHGGLIGIGFWDAAVCDPTPRGVVKAIRYAIDLMGIEHVALGSDYDGATEVLFDVSELAVLTDLMLQENFSEAEIRSVMGENIKDFMLTNLPD